MGVRPRQAKPIHVVWAPCGLATRQSRDAASVRAVGERDRTRRIQRRPTTTKTTTAARSTSACIHSSIAQWPCWVALRRKGWGRPGIGNGLLGCWAAGLLQQMAASHALLFLPPSLSLTLSRPLFCPQTSALSLSTTPPPPPRSPRLVGMPIKRPVWSRNFPSAPPALTLRAPHAGHGGHTCVST